MSVDKRVSCAISDREWEESGCPCCNHENSFVEYRQDGVEIRQCSECEAYYAVLPEGYWQTPFPVKFTDGRFMPMSVQAHPLPIRI